MSTITRIEQSKVAFDYGLLVKHLGCHHLMAAHIFQDFFNTFCGTYKDKVTWCFYELSNQGFYLAPNFNKALLVEIPWNHFKEYLRAEVAGLITTLYTLDACSRRYERVLPHYSEKLITQFKRLAEFANTLKEARFVLKAIA